MKYQYAQVYQVGDEIYIYDGIKESEVENANNYIKALNILGSLGWKVAHIVTEFHPAGFSGYSSMGKTIVERQL